MNCAEFQLGDALVEVTADKVVTTFVDGSFVVAEIAEQPGQADIAEKIGVSVEQMNRDHDLAHSVLAVFMDQPRSPALWAVAHGKTWPGWWKEEAAVLELQALAAELGVSIQDIARRYST